MTDQELEEFTARLAASHEESRREIRENRREIRELRAFQRETTQQIKELGRQIGGLGRKFGSLTEGMAFPSMQRLLRERFRMEFIIPRLEITRRGQSMELDVFGYSNGEENRAVVVEVKSRLDQQGIEQMERTMARFDEFFPEHRGKQRFGIVAAVDCPPVMGTQVHQRGFYLARIQDELFVLDSPESFRPRYFGNGETIRPE